MPPKRALDVGNADDPNLSVEEYNQSLRALEKDILGAGRPGPFLIPWDNPLSRMYEGARFLPPHLFLDTPSGETDYSHPGEPESKAPSNVPGYLRSYLDWRMKQFPGNLPDNTKELYEEARKTGYPKIDPKDLYSALEQVQGITGQIRPFIGSAYPSQGVSMLNSLRLLDKRLPGFSRAMNKLPDVNIGPTKLDPMFAGSYSPKPIPTVSLSSTQKSLTETIIHELLHHWYENLPVQAREAVSTRAMKTPRGMKHLERVANDPSYRPKQWEDEMTARTLTERLLDQWLKEPKAPVAPGLTERARKLLRTFMEPR